MRSLIVLFIMLGAISSATASEISEQVTALIGTDPAAAVTLVSEKWDANARPLNIDIGIQLLRSYNANEQAEEALVLADQLLDESGLTVDAQARLLTGRFKAMTLLKRWDEQDRLIAQAETIAPQVQEPVALQQLFKSIAKVHYGQVKFAVAADFYQRAIDVMGDAISVEQKDLYQDLGVVNAQQGKFPEAVDYLLNALRISEVLGEGESSKLLRNLGAIHIYLKDYDQSIVYTQRSLEVTLQDSMEAAGLHANLGAAYQELDEYEDALAGYTESLRITDLLGAPNPNALNNKAYLLQEQGDFDEALVLLKRAQALYEKSGTPELVAVAKKNRGEVLIKLGARKEAAVLLGEAHDLYLANDIRPKRLELYPVMIDNLEALGRSAQALKMLREYKQLNDETVNVDSAERVAQLQADYEVEKNERELAAMRLDGAIQEKAILTLEHDQQVQRTVQLGLISALAVLGGVAFLLVRAVRFRGRANHVLAQKSEEIKSQQLALLDLNKRLGEQSRRDELTGLNNRRYLAQFLEKEAPRLARAKVDGAHEHQLLMLIDIDHFKQINDKFGHMGGDKVLKVFAQALQSSAREADLVVRWGGEEFLWLCRDAGSEDGSALCERLRNTLSESPITIDDETILPACSIGFAPFPLWGDPPEDWDLSLKAADAALYEAKRSGRDRWVGFRSSTPLNSALVAGATLESLIENGHLKEIRQYEDPAA